MTQQEVINTIQEFIVANGNNEITANILRPILEMMVNQPNEEIGDLTQLNTTDQSSLVASINELIQESGTVTAIDGGNASSI